MAKSKIIDGLKDAVRFARGQIPARVTEYKTVWAHEDFTRGWTIVGFAGRKMLLKRTRWRRR